MNENEYLDAILKQQTLASDSEELKALQEQYEKVKKILRMNFRNCSPTITYGGSKAKGTMMKATYDLDIPCYFSHDDTSAGETLEDIYNKTRKALESDYWIEPKPSALRLKDRALRVDFHIDVVPGRYTDETKTDTFLYQSSGEKKRLKTNLHVHINHVRESGVIEAIRLLKFWRFRNGLRIKHFALELLIIKLLKDSKSMPLARQVKEIWEELRDHPDNFSIEDPANPDGNDLSALLDVSIRSELSTVARATLGTIANSGWQDVFGSIDEESEKEKAESLKRAVASVVAAGATTKPWLPDA